MSGRQLERRDRLGGGLDWRGEREATMIDPVRVLVVEDEPTSSELICSGLAAEGYAMVAATVAAAAISCSERSDG